MPSRSSTVLCCGMAVLDRIMVVEQFHAGGGKLYTGDYDEVGGGPAATAAAAIARLGGEARLVARVGEDSAGTAIVSGLQFEGVHTANVARLPGARSPVSHVTIDAHGERQITHFRGSGLDLAPHWFEEAEAAEAGCVLVDMGWWPGAERIVAAARRAGTPSVLDLDLSADARSLQLLQRVDHVVSSETALQRLSRCEQPLAGLRWLRTQAPQALCLGVTLGAQGYLWIAADGEPQHLPGHAVQVVDTLGAGDVFHGAYALGIAEGLPVAEAARLANAAAALKCSRPGGRRGVPTRAEARQLLQSNLQPSA